MVDLENWFQIHVNKFASDASCSGQLHDLHNHTLPRTWTKLINFEEALRKGKCQATLGCPDTVYISQNLL